ncbi:MAG: anti-sigma factor [Planctomycetes bacterium]|nr:anti-sigma factor [Planctomycetota bacterium]
MSRSSRDNGSLSDPERGDAGDFDRLDELVLDRALWGLDDDEQAELERLGRGSVASIGHGTELAAASLSVALLGDAVEPPPLEVRRRLEACAVRHLMTEHGLTFHTVANALERSAPAARRHDVGAAEAPRPSAAAAPHAPQSERMSGAIIRGRFGLSHLVAAAAVVLAAVLLWRDLASQPTAPDAEYRELTRAAAVDLVHYTWQRGPQADAEVAGDVVFDPHTQRGVMRFRGLQPNDPRQFQYQLWIFDGQRRKEHPIDGGTFDVSASGEAYVPIDARVPVGEAFAFVVTRERPGGVVVSDRSAIVSLAGQLERL